MRSLSERILSQDEAFAVGETGVESAASVTSSPEQSEPLWFRFGNGLKVNNLQGSYGCKSSLNRMCASVCPKMLSKIIQNGKIVLLHETIIR